MLLPFLFLRQANWVFLVMQPRMRSRDTCGDWPELPYSRIVITDSLRYSHTNNLKALVNSTSEVLAEMTL